MWKFAIYCKIILSSQKSNNKSIQNKFWIDLLHFGTNRYLGIKIDSLSRVVENTRWVRRYFAEHETLPTGLLQHAIAFLGYSGGNFFMLHNSLVWLPNHDSGDHWREAASLEDFLLGIGAD